MRDPQVLHSDQVEAAGQVGAGLLDPVLAELYQKIYEPSPSGSEQQSPPAVLQSLHLIGALCPYCMVVWAVTIPILWYVTLHNLRRRFTYHGVALTLWFVLVLTLITEHFWSYWRTLG